MNKLDLTLNFVGAISSILSLRENEKLCELYLTGNPCAAFEYYREFVITVLPQIKILDGIPIERSERILARQMFEEVKQSIQREESQYIITREQTKQKVRNRNTILRNVIYFVLHSIENKKIMWKTQMRILLKREKDILLKGQNTVRKQRSKCRRSWKKSNKRRRTPQMFFHRKRSLENCSRGIKRIFLTFCKFTLSDGTPYNINEARINFSVDDSSPAELIITIQVLHILSKLSNQTDH